MKTQTFILVSALGLLCGVVLIGADSHYNKLQDAGLVATNNAAEDWMLAKSNAVLKVEWIGHPMISDNDKHWPRQMWLPGIQIGLRADGAVVWRKAQQ